jgi:hypothetical protein
MGPDFPVLHSLTRQRDYQLVPLVESKENGFMKTRLLILALAAALGFGPVTALRAVSEKGDNSKVAKLISQLGSKSKEERQKAAKALDDLGQAALKDLRKAAQGDDADLSRRARAVLAKIENRLEAAALKSATPVHLVCKDLPVTDAVALLAKKSKYKIQIDPKAKDKLAKRKITLDTGNVTFWEALDKLCKKAGLVESAPRFGPFPGGPGGGPIRIQIQGGNVGAVQPVQVQVVVNGGVVQVQAQPAQQGGGPGIRPPIGMPVPGVNSVIFLTEGKAQFPTCYDGAFRLRLKPATFPRLGVKKGDAPKFFPALLEVSAEPKVKNWYLLGTPKVLKAVDDKGQKLKLGTPGPIGGGIGGRPAPGIRPLPPVQALPPGGGGGMPMIGFANAPYQRTVYVQLQLGEKKAKKLKEFKGVVAGFVTTEAKPLITVPNILKAAGKTFKGDLGGEIKVVKVDKQEGGNYKITCRMKYPPDAGFGMGWAGGGRMLPPQRGGFGFGGGAPGGQAPPPPAPPGGGIGPGRPPAMPIFGGGLSLVDAKGKAFLLVASMVRGAKGYVEQTLTFKPFQGQGNPAKLVFTGSRRIPLKLAFTFKDVKLP